MITLINTATVAAYSVLVFFAIVMVFMLSTNRFKDKVERNFTIAFLLSIIIVLAERVSLL